MHIFQIGAKGFGHLTLLPPATSGVEHTFVTLPPFWSSLPVGRVAIHIARGRYSQCKDPLPAASSLSASSAKVIPDHVLQRGSIRCSNVVSASVRGQLCSVR